MRRSFLVRAARACALPIVVSSVVVASGCAEDFQPVKQSSSQLSLGDDLFSTMCDRVAASEHPEDLEGRYSHAVCHADADGKYQDDYLPQDGAMPPRVAVMVRYRSDLVAAFNAMFPDKDSLHGDLQDLMKALVPLYDDDTIPESTRTLAAIMNAIDFSSLGKTGESPEDAAARTAKIARAQAAQEALARIGGRKGYRTMSIGVGVAKPMLAYPKMDEVVDTAIHKLGPGGEAEPELRKLLEVTQAELDSAVVPDARKPISKYADRFTGVLNQKPKLTTEILRNLLVDDAPLKGDLTAKAYPATWTDAYARDGLGGFAAETPILVRDARGYAQFSAVPPDAQDKDGDGLPDVDPFGRFLAKSGKPLAIGTPFAVPFYAGTEKDTAPRDALGRALVAPGGAVLYKYKDAAKTMLHSVLVDTRDLATNGALLDAAHASLTLFGPRSAPDKDDRTTGPDKKSYVGSDGSKVDVKYRKYDADQSPLTDLVYATSRFLEFPKAADYFELTRQLLRDHPAETARVIGAALKIRAIANKPEYAGVMLDAKNGLWDDMIAVAIKIAQEPDLLHDVLEGLGDDDILLLSQGMSSFFANKDQLDYDPGADTCWAAGSHPDSTCAAINKPSFNVTKGATKADPGTPADLTKPDTEDNRSLFQRFGSLIHDSYGVRACNKAGATINTKVIGISVKLPLFGTYKECEVLDVPDLATFFLGCLAGGINEATGKARCLLPVTDSTVSAMKAILGDNAVDQILETSSGITGLKQVPTVDALERLVFWRNPNKFVNDLTDFIPTNVCPITDATTTHRACATPNDLMINRQRATIFMSEYFDAAKALRPLITPFVKKRGADKTGREALFIGLIDAMHDHWSKGTDPYRCTKTGTPDTNPRYCTGEDVRQYEKLISEVFATDLLPALNGLTKVTKNMHIRALPTAAADGTDVMVALVNDLINPNNSKGLGIADRKGAVATTTNDGRKIDQTTPFYLFANALNAMDAQWVGPDGDTNHATWRAARSKLVDQFLAVDVPADPKLAKFHNGAMAASMPILVDLIEDRIEEHKNKGDLSKWAREGLWKSFDESLSGPLVASIFDLQEKIYGDPASRTTLNELLSYLADQASSNDALVTTVTTTQDLMQVITDEVNMVPIYHALATGAAPDGATKRSMDLIERIRAIETSDDWKAAHSGRRPLEKIMANAVTPMGKGQASPIEIIIDCITDVNRADPTSTDAFTADDYAAVSKSIDDFLVDKTRGLEQFYTIVKQRKVDQ